MPVGCQPKAHKVQPSVDLQQAVLTLEGHLATEGLPHDDTKGIHISCTQQHSDAVGVKQCVEQLTSSRSEQSHQVPLPLKSHSHSHHVPLLPCPTPTSCYQPQSPEVSNPYRIKINSGSKPHVSTVSHPPAGDSLPRRSSSGGAWLRVPNVRVERWDWPTCSALLRPKSDTRATRP